MDWGWGVGGGVVHDKPVYRGDCLKGGGLGQFADLRGGLARKRGLVFLRRGV